MSVGRREPFETSFPVNVVCLIEQCPKSALPISFTWALAFHGQPTPSLGAGTVDLSGNIEGLNQSRVGEFHLP